MSEIAIIGAGPYGLSVAAYLHCSGYAHRIFGRPMQTWRQMPAGISLKSPSIATNICVPKPNYGFPEWCRARGLEDFEPCSMASFAEYGVWAQQQLVPHLEPFDVVSIRKHGAEFVLTLETGVTVAVRKVVIATGLSYFARLPAMLAALPAALCSHTSQNHHYRGFAGRDVVVIGAGASAIEASAMIHEAGGRPQQIVREDKIVIYDRSARHRPLTAQLRTPDSPLGPGWKSWLFAHLPGLAYHLPEARRIRLDQRYFGPSGPWWIKDRFVGIVPVQLRAEIIAARAEGAQVALSVRGADGNVAEVRADHVVAGTGYEIDVDKLRFLDPQLAAAVRRVLAAPRLSRHFESSVPGLYFAGPIASLSFGPLLRFVAGADFAAKTISRHLLRSRRQKALPRSAAASATADAA